MTDDLSIFYYGTFYLNDVSSYFMNIQKKTTNSKICKPIDVKQDRRQHQTVTQFLPCNFTIFGPVISDRDQRLGVKDSRVKRVIFLTPLLYFW